MIIYNHVIEKLADAGYTAYRIQQEKLISGSTLDRLRHNGPISTETLNVICGLCQCQPGDLLSWEPDKDKD